MRPTALLLMTTLLLSASTALAAEPQKPPVALSVSYYGEALSHPGVAVSVDLGLVETPAFQLSFSPELANYTHPRNHSALILTSRLGARLISPDGFFGELLLGAGLMETWVGGAVYERAENGSIQQRSMTGRARFAVTGSLGLGADFRRINDAPVTWFLRLVVLGETPVNTRFLMHVAVQSGVQFHFGKANR